VFPRRRGLVAHRWRGKLTRARVHVCVVGCATRACSGNRCEAVDVLAALLIKGVAVFTFDFLGCGQSDGDFVTLGVGVRVPKSP
jgi:alpha/beta superfamily hydrolase